MGKWSLPLLAFAFIAVASGCEDDPARPPIEASGAAQPGTSIGGGSGGTSDAGRADASSDAGVCTDLVPAGATVDQTAVGDNLAAGTGGTLLDGTYDLTEARIFVGATGVPGLTGSSYQGTIRITGATFERALVVKGAGGTTTDNRGKGTFTPNGVNASIALTCPISFQEQVTYSVLNSGNTLTIGNLITKESLSYGKRP